VKRTATTDGFFDVLLETDSAQAASMTLQPGQSTGGPENRHPDSDQWLYVVAGQGRATVDGDDVALGEGDLVCIQAGETHGITSDGDERLETLNLYVPPAY
jgi:quercetin dioxygenase-like cupin family protein